MSSRHPVSDPRRIRKFIYHKRTLGYPSATTRHCRINQERETHRVMWSVQQHQKHVVMFSRSRGALVLLPFVSFFTFSTFSFLFFQGLALKFLFSVSSFLTLNSKPIFVISRPFKWLGVVKMIEVGSKLPSGNDSLRRVDYTVGQSHGVLVRFFDFEPSLCSTRGSYLTPACCRS